MIALVTGGNGFVGRSIVEMLLARGERVRVIGRGRYPELEALGAQCFQVDLALPEAAVGLGRAMAGVEAVFHVAAMAGVWGTFESYYRNNVSATQRVVRAAVRAGVPKLVYTSSPSVAIGEENLEGVDESTPYPTRFIAPYPQTKALAEQFVLARRDVATTAIRPHLIWGPRDPHIFPRLIARARKGRLARIGPGTNMVDVTYVENVAEAHLQVAAVLGERSPARGRAYFIGQERPVNLWEFIDRVVAEAGCPPIRRRLSAPAAMRLAGLMELAYGRLGLPGEPPLTRLMVHQMTRSHWFDHSAAQRDFGYGPRISIEEGLRRTLHAG